MNVVIFLFCLLASVHQATVDAIYPLSYHDLTSSHAAILSIRGGAGDSTSAWSAGSKYNYGPTGSSKYNFGGSGSSPSSSRNLQTPSYNKDTQYANEETKEAFADAFLQREDRNRFISRVYAILSAQLLFTAGTIHAFHLNPGVRNWMLFHPAGRKVPLLGLLMSTIAWWITLGIRQSSLMKWPLLFAFTIGESIAVGFISSIYAYSSVIKAMVFTASTTLSVTLYTLMQKNPLYDLSQWGRALSGIGMAFLLFGVVRILELFGIIPYGFLPYNEALYCILGAGLFSLYLAYHTRLIVSGKSAKYQMNEKDYVLGAMSLYSDIINIFLYILRLLGELDDGD